MYPVSTIKNGMIAKVILYPLYLGSAHPRAPIFADEDQRELVAFRHRDPQGEP